MTVALSSHKAVAGYPLDQQVLVSTYGLSDRVSANSSTFERISQRIGERFPDETSTRNYLILGIIAIFFHIAVVYGYIHRDKTSILSNRHHEVEIEFVKPEIVPPPHIDPPKPPPPPPPKVVHQAAPPKPVPVLHTAPAEQNIAPNDLTVPENTEAPKTPEPVVASAETPAPPPPKVEEPVTEATGYASYLHNPPPEYPAFAQRQGWEGTVLLHVHVLASGKADKVDVKQSSGRKTLDDAALASVKNWTFVPSKRGNNPIDGWATVPIEFKLSK